MARLSALLFVILGFTTLSFAQSEIAKPRVSKEPLTAEQVAVYQTFLRFFTNGDDKVLHVANMTEELNVSEMSKDADCSQSFGPVKFETPNPTQATVHMLVSNLTVPGHIAFVDPAQQSEKIRQNDPSKTMREGKPVDHAVKDAFASGLLTLSEIAFNRDHSRAVLSYSFFCGRLCGNGAVVMLKRVGRKWKVTKQSCGEWIS